MMHRSQMMLQSGPARQGGVVLLIALIVLIAMSLIGISMIRQGSTAQLIIGNLAFKEGTNAVADFGVEFTRSRLTSGTLTSGYIADGLSTNNVGFNPFNPPPPSAPWVRIPDESIPQDLWNSFRRAGLVQNDDVQIYYVVHRLCEKSGTVYTVPPPLGSPAGTPSVENKCIVARETSSKEGTSYGNNPTPELFPYYRITVRVTGPRNVTSYVQALMY